MPHPYPGTCPRHLLDSRRTEKVTGSAGQEEGEDSGQAGSGLVLLHKKTPGEGVVL